MLFNYCPFCSKVTTKKDNKYECQNCHKVVYINPKPCVSVMPIRDGQVLLATRKIDPHKGELDLLGGFLEVNETSEEGAIRELLEETGVRIKILDYLGSSCDIYNDSDDHTLILYFAAEIIENEPIACDDIAAVNWYSLDNLPKIGGFKSTLLGLEKLNDWVKRRQ